MKATTDDHRLCMACMATLSLAWLEIIPKNIIMESKTENETELTLRPFCCELNILSQSDGSAMLCEGKTTMIVSVNGPVEVKIQKMLIDRATVETYYRPKAGQPCVADRFIECFLNNICDICIYSNMYPRTAITVSVQEMHDNGGKLACAVNATCLALINAGLDMKFLVAGVTCILDDQNQFLMDPSKTYRMKAEFTFVFENVNFNIVASQTSGTFSDEQYEKAVQVCRDASEKVFEFYRDVMRKFAERIGKRMRLNTQ